MKIHTRPKGNRPCADYKGWFISSKLLARFVDPYKLKTWRSFGWYGVYGPISFKEILGQIKNVNERSQPWLEGAGSRPFNGDKAISRLWHIRHIAYFVKHPPIGNFGEDAIRLSSNCGCLFPVVDGLHRIVACQFIDECEIHCFIPPDDKLFGLMFPGWEAQP